MRAWFVNNWLFAAVLVVTALVAMPDGAAAHAGPGHGDAGISSAQFAPADAAQVPTPEQHCHPGPDCQTVAFFDLVPPLSEVRKTTAHHVDDARSDLRSRIVPFDLPPPRIRS